MCSSDDTILHQQQLDITKALSHLTSQQPFESVGRWDIHFTDKKAEFGNAVIFAQITCQKQGSQALPRLSSPLAVLFSIHHCHTHSYDIQLSILFQN